MIHLTRDALHALISAQLGGDDECLLFPTLTPQEEAAAQEQNRRAEEATSIARYFLQCLVDGYAAGELTFQDYCQKCHDALAVELVDGGTRQRLLGAAVQFALGCDAPKREGRKKRPLWLAEVCFLIVQDVVRYENLPLVRVSKTSKTTADERAVEILKSRGIKGMSPASVEKARAQWRAHTGTH